MKKKEPIVFSVDLTTEEAEWLLEMMEDSGHMIFKETYNMSLEIKNKFWRGIYMAKKDTQLDDKRRKGKINKNFKQEKWDSDLNTAINSAKEKNPLE